MESEFDTPPNMRNKSKQPRNYHAVNAKMRNSAGSMDKKKRKNTKRYVKLREELEEALETLKEIEDEDT